MPCIACSLKAAARLSGLREGSALLYVLTLNPIPQDSSPTLLPTGSLASCPCVHGHVQLRGRLPACSADTPGTSRHSPQVEAPSSTVLHL